ncbi:MAG: hypothetical protein IT204_21865 [Fimbriimonadaceae bacterium]|nr:hypothetical protein [Fimbriimonadaceae bacterium]
MRVWSSLLLLGLVSAALAAPPPLLSPNDTEFPDSSLLDLTRPAPPRDFLRVSPAGQFVYPDGRRARFWGLNLAHQSVMQPPERIDQVIDRIARAGFNLVRLHHLDDAGRGFLQVGAPGLAFDPERLRLLDHWIWRCGQRGLAVYLDLLDYRNFSAAEGIAQAAQLGRGAKPYAVFDAALIADQQRYAKALLRDHRNPLTGRCYADDPTVALLELYDENGLFIRRMEWLSLVQPYRAQLTALWNRYLRLRHGSSAALAAAWGAGGSGRPLEAGWSVERGTVPLQPPRLAPDSPAGDAAERLARARSADAVRFADGLQRAYFRTMRQYLREVVGARQPLTAVGDFTCLPDLRGIAAELDFLGTNYYFDHPVFQPGQAWREPYFFQLRNPLQSTDSWSLGPALTLARMADRPLVVREWNHCFPNPYRAAGMLEVTAYAALQDLDALILFTYGAVPTERQISYFDVHSDPARWGLAALLGRAFLDGQIAPARRQVELGYSDLETVLFKQYRSPLRQLAYVSRLANRCFEQQWETSADLTIASGRSASARYRGERLLLWRGDPVRDSSGREAAETADLLGYPLPLRQLPGDQFRFDGRLLASGSVARGAGGMFPLAALAQRGVQPVGLGSRAAVGFWDVAAGVFGFGDLRAEEQVRAALDALQLLYGDGVGQAQPPRFVADTGQLDRDAGAGLLRVEAPHLVAVAGRLGQQTWQLGPLRLTTAAPQGVMLLASLDEQPLATSRAYVLKCVSSASNSGQVLLPPGRDPAVPDRWRLDRSGQTPVISDGAPGDGWRVERDGQPLLATGQRGGVVELVVRGDQWWWFSDTVGATLEVPASTAEVVTPAGQRATLTPPWVWPAGAAVVELRSVASPGQTPPR